jgi:hypothetical protein
VLAVTFITLLSRSEEMRSAMNAIVFRGTSTPVHQAARKTIDDLINLAMNSLEPFSHVIALHQCLDFANEWGIDIFWGQF